MIRVTIERKVAEGLEEFYEAAIADMLGVLANAPGFLSGESLVDLQRPNHYVVFTRWVDESAWNRWYISAERQQQLDAVLSAAPVCFFVLDRKGRIRLAEGSVLTDAGLRAEDLLQRPAREVVEHDPRLLELLERGLAGEELEAQMRIGGRILEARTLALNRFFHCFVIGNTAHILKRNIQKAFGNIGQF